jgi:hypothetical protein
VRSFALHCATPPAWATQHSDAQSSWLKHWPVMNCARLPFPTFWFPAIAELIAHAAEDPAGGAELLPPPVAGTLAAGALPPSPKPQPPLPAALATASPEQIPLLASPTIIAQHEGTAAWLQSAVLLQPPVMNCKPLPLPTLAAPLGSGLIGLGDANTPTTTRTG